MKQREEQLTASERNLLRRKAIVVSLFGLGIGGITVYMLFFTNAVGSLGFPVYLFAFFFFGILGFILFVHIRNSVQVKKSVYTGIVTDKREHTMTTRKELGQTTYSVILDDTVFSIDHALYNKIHRGDYVELHCLKGTVVFEATILRSAADQPAVHQSTPEITTVGEVKPAVGDKNILLKALTKAVLVHVLLYGFVAFVLVFVLNLVTIITIKDTMQFLWLFRVIFYGVLLIWVLMNVSTVRLLLDVITGKTQEKIETIIDMQSGNLPKPSRNSVRTYQGFYYRNDQFYYAQTEKHWLELSAELYGQLKTGNRILLTCGHYSGTVLRVEKTSELSF